jgi:predicted Zn-ribbon and HTH transcriptional regulator
MEGSLKMACSWNKCLSCGWEDHNKPLVSVCPKCGSDKVENDFDDDEYYDEPIEDDDDE